MVTDFYAFWRCKNRTKMNKNGSEKGWMGQISGLKKSIFFCRIDRLHFADLLAADTTPSWASSRQGTPVGGGVGHQPFPSQPKFSSFELDPPRGSIHAIREFGGEGAEENSKHGRK